MKSQTFFSSFIFCIALLTHYMEANYFIGCDNHFCLNYATQIFNFCCQENNPLDRGHFTKKQICCNNPCYDSYKRCTQSVPDDNSSEHGSPWIAIGIMIGCFVAVTCFIVLFRNKMLNLKSTTARDNGWTIFTPRISSAGHRSSHYHPQIPSRNNVSSYGTVRSGVSLSNQTNNQTVHTPTSSRNMIQSVSPPQHPNDQPPAYEICQAATNSSCNTTQNGYSPFINQFLQELNFGSTSTERDGHPNSQSSMNQMIEPPPSYDEATRQAASTITNVSSQLC